MRTGHSEQHGIGHQRINAIERPPNQTGQALRLGAFNQREQWTRRVILAREHEPINAGASHVEEIVGALGHRGDISDEREPRKSLLELPHAFEIGPLLPIQVHDRNPDRLAIADPNQACPIGTFMKLMTVANGSPKSLDLNALREQSCDYAHFGEWGEGT